MEVYVGLTPSSQGLLSKMLTPDLKAGPYQATSTPSLWEIQALPATLI